MAKVCHLCGKSPKTGFNVSHSNRKTKRRWLPNLQRTKLTTKNKNTKHVYLCTTCLRTAKISLQIS